MALTRLTSATRSSTFVLVEAAGDLVEQQQFRVAGERARKLQTLAIQQRQPTGRCVGARFGAAVGENLQTAALRVTLRALAAEAGGDDEVLEHRHLAEGLRDLEGAAKARACSALPAAARPSGRPSNTISPASGATVPVISPSSVVLPAPFGPSTPTRGAGLDVEIEIARDDDGAEGFETLRKREEGPSPSHDISGEA